MKKKVLIVMRSFVQAGAEKYQYEIIKALDKSKYTIDVFSPFKLGNFKHKGFDKDFYYPIIKKLVNKIVFFEEEDKNKNENLLKKYKKKLLGIVTKDKNFINKKQLDFFLKDYDIINIVEADFLWIKNTSVDFRRVFIHMVITKMQTFPISPYYHFDFEKHYNFVGSLPLESARYELSEFRKSYNFISFPLIFDTSLIKSSPSKPKNKPYKIGIFTRIDHQNKPLTPFFFALHLLICRGINIQLHLFGAGDPSGFNRIIKMFSLENHFRHEGHQEDLDSCLEKYNLNLAWFHANNYHPGGYAAFELMCRALPNVFWDFLPLNKKRQQGSDPFPFFWEIEKFINYTQMLLENPHIAKSLGEMQRETVIENQDAKRFIPILENAFDNL